MSEAEGNPTSISFYADADQEFEIFDFVFYAHRLRQGLVAVSQIHAAPNGRFGNGFGKARCGFLFLPAQTVCI